MTFAAPTAPAVSDEDLYPAVMLLAGRTVVALTGAGLSTESGIPDYRGPETRRRARTPMRFHEFAGSEAHRRRYWARATRGWPSVGAAAPNRAHAALAALEEGGQLRGVITQNVDGLHHRAGSRRVVELHGSLHEVLCLACGGREDRAAVHARILDDNPALFRGAAVPIAPDGDADLDTDLGSFRAPACLTCGGDLRPDVVFFGENVPRPRAEAAFALFDEADVLLVAGSSLTVLSGYRFVRRARERGVPVVVVNLDDTRGDPDATLVLRGTVGDILPRLALALRGR